MISLIQGDITKLDVEAIVNAANETLLGGGGVDGAIHRAAGGELLEFCRLLKGCDTGRAKITPGFNLKADYIIHTVGPVWRGGQSGEAALLSSCYWSSLEEAVKAGVSSIAFPCISTGIFGYPADNAAAIAFETVSEFLENTSVELSVVFCCYTENDLQIYRKLLQNC